MPGPGEDPPGTPRRQRGGGIRMPTPVRELRAESPEELEWNPEEALNQGLYYASAGGAILASAYAGYMVPRLMGSLMRMITGNTQTPNIQVEGYDGTADPGVREELTTTSLRA